MNILFVIDGNFPTPEASSKRLANYIKALNLGHISVDTLPVSIKTKYNFLNVLCQQLIPILASWRVYSKVGNNSIVFVYGFGWVGKLLIIIASRLRKKTVCAEINERPYSIHGSRRDYVLKYIEPFHYFCLTRLVYRMFDGFIVISESLSSYIGKFKRKSALVNKIPILVDFEFYQKHVKKPDVFSPFILHSATINDHKDGIINVLHAFAKVVTEKGVDLHFYFTSKVGLYETMKHIDEIIIQNGLRGKTHFLGDIDEDTLLAYQAHCSMSIINKVNCEQNRYNFATRIGEYLALGKPIITTAIGEVSNYLQQGISCLYVTPNCVDEIAESILTLLNKPDFGAKIGIEGKIIAKSEFDYKAQSKNINHFFLELVNRSKNI